MIATPFIVKAFWFGARAGASELSQYENIQTMQLLEALPPSDTPRGGPEIEIDENALVAELGSSGTAMDVYEVPTSDLITTYVVRPGDSLASIAGMFDVTSNTIRWANGMSAKDSVKPGQELLILPITGVRHIVKKGDSIATIAKSYKGDAEEIASYNGVGVGDALTVGEIVIIPDGEVSAPTSQTTKKTSTSAKNGKQYDAATGKYYTVSTTSKSGTAAASGYFIRPTKGIKTQGFHGPYNAVDIGAPVGTPIYAAAAGKVIAARPSGYNGGYGQMVIIQHGNGSQSLYAHMSKVVVTTGQTVEQGEQIGAVGNTGRSTGPHLHLEFRNIKTPVLY